mmetsp:Transcript_34492/g.33679  ORF Transcript_34492/g.33679 Transcript_34492/m.33679 type:complete len:85 (-) Transcript_34492:288-542(-)
MESKNNDNTTLCSNCKSFYGGPETNFMCSKCYKQWKETQPSSPMKSLSSAQISTLESNPNLEQAQALAPFGQHCEKGESRPEPN